VVVSFLATRASGVGYSGWSRCFDLECTTNLAASGWQPVAGYLGLPGDGQLVTSTNLPSTNTWFRLKVWQE
jgi:hypothetical protein